MSIILERVAEKYLVAKRLSDGTRKEYRSTVTKWVEWGQGVAVDQIERHHIRDYLDWVHDKATNNGGSNAGRTANKARETLRALLSWAWEQDYLEKLPRFPKPKPQRDVAGRHYLTKSDLNALYFATHELPRPRGWNRPLTVGHYWRAALVVFFNYGVDTGTVFKTAGFHEPSLWRHVSWRRESPNGQGQESRYGWMYYRRVKTKKSFDRPMNRVVQAHLKRIRPTDPQPDQPVFDSGSSRPNAQFQLLCRLAGVKPKQDIETGADKPWVLNDLRKTCATYYDAHMPESSIEILGHSVGGVTYRHYAHRDPLAHKAILSLRSRRRSLRCCRDSRASVPAVTGSSGTRRQRECRGRHLLVDNLQRCSVPTDTAASWHRPSNASGGPSAADFEVLELSEVGITAADALRVFPPRSRTPVIGAQHRPAHSAECCVASCPAPPYAGCRHERRHSDSPADRRR